jgi:hypothetical protein
MMKSASELQFLREQDGLTGGISNWKGFCKAGHKNNCSDWFGATIWLWWKHG